MRIRILRLYKDLLRYGEELKYTDNTYFKRRVKVTFRKNKLLADEKEIEFQFQVMIIPDCRFARNLTCFLFQFSERIKATKRSKSGLMQRDDFSSIICKQTMKCSKVLANFIYLKFPKSGTLLVHSNKTECYTARSMSLKKYLDYSKVPKINEADIELQFVRGSGPGGQATNKTNNAVLIKHIPTGIVVKCHETRSLWENKKKAIENLVTKLDNLMNGKESIEAQTKAILDKKSAEKNRKKKKLDELKAAFKEREGLK